MTLEMLCTLNKFNCIVGNLVCAIECEDCTRSNCNDCDSVIIHGLDAKRRRLGIKYHVPSSILSITAEDVVIQDSLPIIERILKVMV